MTWRITWLLAWRWFRSSDAHIRRTRRLRVMGTAMAAFTAVLAVTFVQANADRVERGKAQQPAPGAPAQFRALQVDVPFGQDVWSTVFMRASEDSPPTPPGVPSFPRPGETWISPAVGRLIESRPESRARVPGRIVGVISPGGLQSPDQLFVYAGAEETAKGWWSARGWGAPALSSSRPSIPVLPFFGLVAALLGLPIALVIRSASMLAVSSRSTSLGAAALLGVAPRILARAAGLDALFSAVLGSLFGVAGSAILVSVVHASDLVGISWFVPPTVLTGWALVAGTVGIWAPVAWLTMRNTRRLLTDPWGARSAAPVRGSRLGFVLLAAGVTGLAGIVFLERALAFPVPSSVTIWYFFLGGGATVAGALLAAPGLIGRLSAGLRRRDGGAVWFLGIRRLGWDRDFAAQPAQDCC